MRPLDSMTCCDSPDGLTEHKIFFIIFLTISIDHRLHRGIFFLKVKFSAERAMARTLGHMGTTALYNKHGTSLPVECRPCKH